MRSYKNWKIVNESYLASGINLGLVQPQVLGIKSDLPLSEKKKVPGKVVVDKEENDKEQDDSCSCKNKKKMKKHMHGEIEPIKMKKVADDDDVNDVDVPDEEDEDEGDVKDVDVEDEDGDEENVDVEDGEEEDVDDDDVDDEGDDAPKFGFMKDKKKKCKSKMKKEDVEQMDDSEKEFWASLKRQCGEPFGKRYGGGVKGDGINEDLLLTPDQLALFNSMPGAGEVGYAPVQKVGGVEQSEAPELDSFSYGESIEETLKPGWQEPEIDTFDQRAFGSGDPLIGGSSKKDFLANKASDIETPEDLEYYIHENPSSMITDKIVRNKILQFSKMNPKFLKLAKHLGLTLDNKRWH